MCLWGIWLARNKWIFSGIDTHPRKLVESSLTFLSSFQARGVILNSCTRQLSDYPAKGLPPDIGWFMLNTDASFSNTGASYAYILRNHHGRILQSGTGPLLNVQSAEHAEVMALWWSFSHIQAFWGSPLVLATDCQRLVSQLNQQERNWTVLGGVIEGLRQHLTKGRKWKIILCPRNTNMAAHRLAKLVLL